MVRPTWPAVLALAAASAWAEPAIEPDISIITAADIAHEKPADLLEMLRSRVGLDVNNSLITMRGVKGIAVFVDGFASSAAEFSRLRPEQIEKMEILRGAASARFGAEAMGGAIAITTRGAHRAHGELTQGIDSRRGRYTRIGGGREANGLGWSILAENAVQNGFRTVPGSPFPYQITVADERGDAQLIDGKLGWKSGGLEMSLNLKRNDGWSFFGRPNWSFDWRTDNIRAQMMWRISDRLALEAALGQECYRTAGSRDRGTGTDAAGLAAENWLTQRYRQRESTVSLALRDEKWTARAGINLVDLDETFANADYASRAEATAADSAIRKEALFVGAELAAGAGHLELGLRRDLQRYLTSRTFDAGPPAQETRGSGVLKSATSPKLALSWPLASGHRLRGSLGTGFLPPPAGQLYNGYLSAGSITLANPGLKPELSTTIDLGITRTGASGEAGLTLFATRWRDKIASRIVSYGMPNISQPRNVGEVTAHGLEASGSRRFADGWSISANYTGNRTRIVKNDAEPSTVGNELPDMPRHKANLVLGHDPSADFSARIKLRAAGATFTDEANTVTDPRGYRWRKAGYAVLDLSATWRYPTWELTLAVDNAANRDYVTGFFWHGEPRTLRVVLTLRY